MEEQENMSPFWLQTPHRRRRGSSSSSSLIFNSGVLIVILLIVAIAFIFFIIPSFLSFTSQIFRPNSVKKSWDSLNLVLVLFAIVCGFLSRNASNNGNNGSSESTATTRSAYEEDYKFENRSESFGKSNPETPRRFWYDHHHPYNSSNGTTTLNKLRSFSSYPDLRQEEASWMSRDDYQWRFYDDTRLYDYRSSSSKQKLEVEDSSTVDYLQNYPWLQPRQQKVEVEEEEKEKENVKNVEVDAIMEEEETDAIMEEEESPKEVIRTPPPPPASPPPRTAPYPPPQQPQAKMVRRKVRRTH